MKRANLFRGKRQENGEWVYGGTTGSFHEISEQPCIVSKESWELPDIEDECIEEYVMIEVIPETIGQFTGMLDRKNKQIFEGDILRLYMGQIVEVRFINGCFSFYLNEKSHSPFDDLECGNSTVIGNIADNPKLMK